MYIRKENFQIIDLTHTLKSDIPTWFDEPSFEIKILSTHEEAGYHEMGYTFHFAGIGTHIDAPLHFIKAGNDVSSIPLEQLAAHAHVIDLSGKATAEYLVTVEDIKNHEDQHGKITEEDIVLIQTGWSQKHWNNPAQYINRNSQKKMRFPTIDALTGKYLAEKRIKGLGIDTLSPDLEESGFPVHKELLNNNIYLLENLANLHKLPPTGSTLISLPLKIENGAESPLRVIALLRG